MANITKINLQGVEYNLTDKEAQSQILELKENTYNKTEVDDLINTIDIKIDGIDLTPFETIEGAAAKYQPKGDYLTEHQDISNKVDKVEGKDLSTNDYTDADKAKLDATPTFWVGTQAEYDAIAVKDNNTFYYITEE